jgi:hypothetical protein
LGKSNSLTAGDIGGTASGIVDSLSRDINSEDRLDRHFSNVVAACFGLVIGWPFFCAFVWFVILMLCLVVGLLLAGYSIAFLVSHFI